MALNSFSSNQGTQSALLTDNTGGTAGTLIPVMKIDYSSQGTAGTLFTGTILGVNNIGTLPNLPGGSIQITAGTIGTVTGIGSISSLGSLGMLNAGTINSLGTMGTLGTVTNIGQVYNAGTLQGGTINTGTVVNRGNDTVDATNSSTGTLAANGTFVGGTTDTLGYAAVSLYVYSDQSSAANGVQIRFSSNGTNFNDATVDTFTAGNAAPNDGQTYASAVRARYMQIQYINGAVNQTAFRLATVLRVNSMMGDLIPVSDIPTQFADHAQLVKAALMGKSTSGGGTWIDIKVNPSGAIQADPANGTVQISAGTINLGTFNMASGTLNLGTVNMNSGTLNVGTVVNNGGTIAVVQNAGTLQTGANTIGNIGTLQVGTITTGTINTGTFVMTSGTLNVGTVVNNGGTIQVGTFQWNALPTAAMPTFGTHGTTGASIFGTLVGGTGSGAGTEIFLTSVSLTIPSTGGSQDVSIGWGTNGGTFHSGTGRIVRGNYPAGGGIQKTFNPPINSGTNAQLCYFQAGAGTVDIDITYFTTTSTL